MNTTPAVATHTDALRASRPTSNVWAYMVRDDRAAKWYDIQDGRLPIARLVRRTAENAMPSPGWWATIDTDELRTVLRHDDGEVRYFETAQQALDAVDIAWTERSTARTGRPVGRGDVAATCPRCETDLATPMTRNALSRLDNKTHVCGECGTAEAMWNFQHPGAPLPAFDQPIYG